MIDLKPATEFPPAQGLAGCAPAPARFLGNLLLWSSLLLLLVPLFVYNDDPFRLTLYAKYLALAILALGVDLIWGYTGMLSLGQGLYFGLGAYCVGFSLELQQAAQKAGVAPGLAAPNFMNYTNLPVTHPDYHPPAALPFIAPLANIWIALAAAILIPMIVAALFGLMTFRLRIRGVYFSLITQALLLAVFMLVMNQQPYTGGFVGLKDLADLKLFGITFDGYSHASELYLLTLGVLLVCLVGCALLMRSKFGKILTAIRDNENRVLALGYSPGMYKLFIFTLAGGLAGLAGALFTAANGLCGTQYLSVAFSINAVVLVAVGGRGTLFGAVLGAILVSTAEFQISSKYENYWPIFLGSLFVVCVLFLPDGILGGLRRLSLFVSKGFRKPSPEAR